MISPCCGRNERTPRLARDSIPDEIRRYAARRRAPRDFREEKLDGVIGC
jgi:hypothetical protein